jgi:Histidine phosphatase superfamily (branch 1)
MKSNRKRWPILVALVLVFTEAAIVFTGSAPAFADRTIIYFVRHGENDPSTSNQELTQQGKARAGVFTATVRDIPFSHVFSSHTTRSRQTVEAVAKQRALSVVQLPKPGSVVEGATINDRTPAKVAIKPLVETLRLLPPGSTVLVGVNSDNVYAILNGLGVRVATSDQPCSLGSTCVPCLDNTCFPRDEFDNLWILIVDFGQAPHLVHLRYATPSVSP